MKKLLLLFLPLLLCGCANYSVGSVNDKVKDYFIEKTELPVYLAETTYKNKYYYTDIYYYYSENREIKDDLFKAEFLSYFEKNELVILFVIGV